MTLTKSEYEQLKNELAHSAQRPTEQSEGLDRLVSLPWRIDQDNDNGLCVVDARGEIVYVEDWGGIPDEMSSTTREQIIEQARANARFMVSASADLAG